MELQRGCFGCCTKPTPVVSVTTPSIAVDEPPYGPRIQKKTEKEPSIAEDFWGTSTYEMDSSAVESQKSVSSISKSNLTLDPHSGIGTSKPFELVNHGLLLWNQTRQQWVGNKRPDNRKQEVRGSRISWNATYDSLLGTSKPFHRPIPLSEMVDFLVDVWEHEGLYD